MSNKLPITVGYAPISPAFKGDIPQIQAEFARLLFLQTQQSFALFVAGSTEPPSNQGPWLKNDNTWYVWSAAEGQYVPQTLEQESLRYHVGPDEPDPNKFLFWIRTSSSTGEPLSVNTYVGAPTNNWVSVYYTKTEVDALVAAAANYHGAHVLPSGQQVPADGTATTVEATKFFDTANLYDLSTNLFTVDRNGFWELQGTLIFLNNTATASGVQISMVPLVNGLLSTARASIAVASPPNNVWGITLPPIPLQLVVGNTIGVQVIINDGVGTGTVGIQSVGSISLVYRGASA